MPTRFLVLILAAASISTASAQMRPWKNTDGSRSVQGDFVSRDAASVTIRTVAGKDIKIELTKLHPDETTWLQKNHPLGGPAPHPSAVFDTLLFGDDRKTVEEKLKASKIVETSTDETFFGRSGLNGLYWTRQKIGKVRAALYFGWTDSDKLEELTLQTDLLPESDYKSELEPTWGSFIELLSMLYGKPVQNGPMPQKETLSPGMFMPSHLWELEGGNSALLGTACEGKGYQLVVRFTRKKIEVVEIP